LSHSCTCCRSVGEVAPQRRRQHTPVEAVAVRAVGPAGSMVVLMRRVRVRSTKAVMPTRLCRRPSTSPGRGSSTAQPDGGDGAPASATCTYPGTPSNSPRSPRVQYPLSQRLARKNRAAVAPKTVVGNAKFCTPWIRPSQMSCSTTRKRLPVMLHIRFRRIHGVNASDEPHGVSGRSRVGPSRQVRPAWRTVN
jgi:hypothetical protein